MNKWCLNRYNQDFCERIIQKYSSFGIYEFAGISLTFFLGKKAGIPITNGKPDISLQVFYKSFVYHQFFRKNAGDWQRQTILQEQSTEQTRLENIYLPGSAARMLYLKRNGRREEEILQIFRDLYGRRLSRQESGSIWNEQIIQKEISALTKEKDSSESRTERRVEELLEQLERKSLTEKFELTEEERRESVAQISRILRKREISEQNNPEPNTLGQSNLWYPKQNTPWDPNPNQNTPWQERRYASGSIRKMLYLKRSVRREEEIVQIFRKLYDRGLTRQESGSIWNERIIQKEISALTKEKVSSESLTERLVEEFLDQLERKSLTEKFELTEEERRETVAQISRILRKREISEENKLKQNTSNQNIPWQERQHASGSIRKMLYLKKSVRREEEIAQIFRKLYERGPSRAESGSIWNGQLIQKEISAFIKEKDSSDGWIERRVEELLDRLERKSLSEKFELTEEERRETVSQISRILGKREVSEENKPNQNTLWQERRSASGSIPKMLYLKRSVRREEEIVQIFRKLYERKLLRQESGSIWNEQIIQKEISALIKEKDSSESRTERRIEEFLDRLERKSLTEKFELTEEERRETVAQISRILRKQEISEESKPNQNASEQNNVWYLNQNNPWYPNQNAPWQERKYASGSIPKMLYLKRSVRREEEIVQIFRKLYERKLERQESGSIWNEQIIQKEILALIKEKDSSESRTERRVEELLDRLERKSLTEKFELTEEERRETVAQISRILRKQEISEENKPNQNTSEQNNVWYLNQNNSWYPNQNTPWQGRRYDLGSIRKMLYLKRSVRREEEIFRIFHNLHERKSSQQENRRIVDTQLKFRKDQERFRSQEVQTVQKKQAAENVLLKKETVLVRKSVEEQESRLHVLQEELRRQKKEMESLAGKISGSVSALEVNPQRVTEQVLREMQKQFRLEKARRGM